MSLRAWLHRVAELPVTSHHVIRGFAVTVENTRADIATDDVVRRLDAALGLVAQYVPHSLRHMRRDFAGIVVRRYACRGAFFPDSRLCMVELTFTVNRDFTPAQVAATVLHEGAHARLHALGFPLEMDDRARQERFCRRAEIEFGKLVPGGEAVIARALGTLSSADEEVAPDVEWRLAAERVAAADREAKQRGR
jgi:hypothetical protein